MARPTKLTPEVQRKICDAVSGGNFRNVAARWAGVPLSTFWHWCQQGKAATKGRKREFWEALLEAEKAAEIRAVALIMKAAQDDAKHAQWWLERKHHKRWGRKDLHKVTITSERMKEERERMLKLLLTDGDDDETNPAA